MAVSRWLNCLSSWRWMNQQAQSQRSKLKSEENHLAIIYVDIFLWHRLCNWNVCSKQLMQKFETTQGHEMYASLQIKACTTTICQIGEQNFFGLTLLSTLLLTYPFRSRWFSMIFLFPRWAYVSSLENFNMSVHPDTFPRSALTVMIWDAPLSRMGVTTRMTLLHLSGDRGIPS